MQEPGTAAAVSVAARPMDVQIKPAAVPVIGGEACKRSGLGGVSWCRSQAVAILSGNCFPLQRGGGGGGLGGEGPGRKEEGIKVKDVPCPGRWRTSETCPIVAHRLKPQPSPFQIPGSVVVYVQVKG
jgi:hypothetical protein